MGDGNHSFDQLWGENVLSHLELPAWRISHELVGNEKADFQQVEPVLTTVLGEKMESNDGFIDIENLLLDPSVQSEHLLVVVPGGLGVPAPHVAVMPVPEAWRAVDENVGNEVAFEEHGKAMRKLDEALRDQIGEEAVVAKEGEVDLMGHPMFAELVLPPDLHLVSAKPQVFQLPGFDIEDSAEDLMHNRDVDVREELASLVMELLVLFQATFCVRNVHGRTEIVHTTHGSLHPISGNFHHGGKEDLDINSGSILSRQVEVVKIRIASRDIVLIDGALAGCQPHVSVEAPVVLRGVPGCLQITVDGPEEPTAKVDESASFAPEEGNQLWKGTRMASSRRSGFHLPDEVDDLEHPVSIGIRVEVDAEDDDLVLADTLHAAKILITWWLDAPFVMAPDPVEDVPELFWDAQHLSRGRLDLQQFCPGVLGQLIASPVPTKLV